MKLLNYNNVLKMNEKGEADGGGGAPPQSQATPPAQSQASGTPPEGKGDIEYDDLGYQIVKPPVSGEQNKAGNPPAQSEPPKADDKAEDSATGYGAEPPKVEPPAATPPATPPADEKIELGFELKVEGLDAARVKHVQEFAKKHALSKEAAQAYADEHIAAVKKATEDFDKAKKAMESKQLETRAAWDKELRDDPKFGGQNFTSNLRLVDDFMKEFMPNTKKVLTERKSMLPPYVMRDLAAAMQLLKQTPKFVSGEGTKPPSEEQSKKDDPNAHLDFYTKQS